jgi:hypothetical protein
MRVTKHSITRQMPGFPAQFPLPYGAIVRASVKKYRLLVANWGEHGLFAPLKARRSELAST